MKKIIYLSKIENVNVFCKRINYRNCISLVLLVKKFSKRDLIGGIITIKNIFFY